MTDPFDPQRFLDAQSSVYPLVLDELRRGRKQSHWMWFIFPQLAGLAHSAKAQRFAIASRAFVNGIEDRTILEILGRPDDLKFHSSMFLFGAVSSNGAIDLARTRIALGIARLIYAGLIVLMICAGYLFGFTIGGTTLSAAGPSTPVPLVADVIAAGGALAAFGTFFSMPWRQLPFPIAVGMIAHAARWALISFAGANVATEAFVACILVSVIVTPVPDRWHLPFAALAFSAVVSMMPGLFLFHAASGIVELVSIGPAALAILLTTIAANGATAFLVITAMTFGLILPRMLFERFLPAPT
jgi:uncharacterized protein (DUF1810 family)/uncharacterized membrane protein YjjB (DUF3815 family)